MIGKSVAGKFLGVFVVFCIMVLGCENDDDPIIDAGSTNTWEATVPWAGSGDHPDAIGDVSFSLVWTHQTTDEGPDIDIWVTDPYNQTLSASRDAYALGPTPEGGIIDHDDLGRYGTGNGGGPERAYWPIGAAPSGTYTFGINFYSGQSGEQVQISFLVYRGTTIIATYAGTYTNGDGRLTVGSVIY